MKESEPRSVAEIAKYSEEMWGHGFETAEQAYEDAMLNGEYHEECVGLSCLVDLVGEKDLVRVFLPVAQALVAGSVDNRVGDEGIQIIMRCHDLLVKWSRKQLESHEELLKAMVEVRELVLKELRQSRNHWWFQTLDQMHFVEAVVYYRSGMHRVDLDSAYGTEIFKIEK